MDSKKTADLPIPARTPPGETMPGPSKPRILLVEDNPVNRLIASEMLECLGYEVDEAVDGTEAVLAAGQRIHALILMDCHMPGLDGYAASRVIRDQESQRGLARAPIVALTGNTGEADRKKCRDSGMDDHLSKPFTMEQLKEMCGKWISPPENPVG
jgi:CheY-like chemotaxis protein